jgi:DNA-binding NarL/FixJ family response regulator
MLASSAEDGVVEGGHVRIGVLVVDDHDLFRVGLVTLLARTEGLEVVGQASGGRMAVRLAAELRPDVILLDLRMPGVEGPAVIREIVANEPSARVVVLTVVADEVEIAAAVSAGACGYVLKDTAVDEVVEAIRAAASGNAWLSPRAARALLDHVQRTGAHVESVAKLEAELSSRELEVLHLLARGMDNGEIAAALFISPRTAKNHVSSILNKLGVSNRVKAAIYAVRHGIT